MVLVLWMVSGWVAVGLCVCIQWLRAAEKRARCRERKYEPRRNTTKKRERAELLAVLLVVG